MKVLNKILNNFFVRGYCARSIKEDPLQKFRFRVTVAGLPSSLGFQKVSGLTHEVDVAEYSEGGWDYAHKLPGKPKVGEITLERGSYVDLGMKELIQKTLVDPNVRSTIIIEHLDRYGDVRRTYKLAEAWASKWESSDLDASSGDVAIEKLTLQFEKFLD